MYTLEAYVDDVKRNLLRRENLCTDGGGPNIFCLWSMDPWKIHIGLKRAANGRVYINFLAITR